MSKEHIEEMAENLRYCHTEFVGDYGDVYTDYSKTAEKLAVMGYHKQSEGEWVFEHEYYGKMLCSNCKGEALVNECSEYVDSDYCPNCGAKMKGV